MDIKPRYLARFIGFCKELLGIKRPVAPVVHPFYEVVEVVECTDFSSKTFHVHKTFYFGPGESPLENRELQSYLVAYTQGRSYYGIPAPRPAGASPKANYQVRTRPPTAAERVMYFGSKV